MNIKLKNALNISVLFIVLVLGFLIWQLSVTYKIDETKTVSIRTGASLREVAYDLSQQGIISAPETFIMYMKFIGKAGGIHAGEYEFFGDINLKRVARTLIAGKVKQYAFTLVEGWHIDQLIDALEETATLIHEPNVPLTPDIIQKKLKITLENPEGLFFPDTYFYTRANSKLEILDRAHKNMNKVLAYLWEQRPRSLPYQTPYEALIVASMIEKETAVPEERPLVASVIINRLYHNMPLQIDPTVIYGLHHQSKLTKDALRKDTPYNTYLHRGLPPTPIAMPSLESLRAAIFPAFTDYFYFVAKGDGSHAFSKTLQEQTAAIKRYQLRHNDVS